MPAMAEAVSWVAGAMSLGIAKGVERGQRTLQAAEDGPGMNDGRSGVEGEIEQAEEFLIPVACLEAYESGVSGVGVLGDAAATQPVKDVLGQHDPGSVGIDAVFVAWRAVSASNW